jgi:predicted RNA-binding Zn-ribbon protein involved in translation (DUF1610 family)
MNGLICPSSGRTMLSTHGKKPYCPTCGMVFDRAQVTFLGNVIVPQHVVGVIS